MKELFEKDSVEKNVTLTFENGDVYTNANIFSEEMELSESLCSSKSLKFGSCEASSLQVTVANPTVSHIGQSVTVQMALSDGEETESMTIGTFYVAEDKHDANRTKRKLVCYDKMADILAMECADWYNKTLPNANSSMTLKAFRDSFASFVGIEQEEATLINDTMTVRRTIEPSSISGKDILTAICELNGVFGHISRDGKLQYIRLKYADTVSADRMIGKNYSSCEYEDFTTKAIDKLQIRQEEDDIGLIYGSGSNCYIVENNFLVYGKASDELEDIASQLYSLISIPTYTPCKIVARGDLTASVGDTVNVEGKHKAITSYILQRTVKGIQSLKETIESKGVEVYSEDLNSTNKSIIQLLGKSNTLTRTIEETKSTITDLEKSTSSSIQQTAEKIEAEVTRAKGAENELDSKITQTSDKITIEVSKLQQEIDGDIKTYNVSEIPTLLNYPAWDFTYNIPCNNTVKCNVPFEYNDEYYGKNARSLAFDETAFISYRFMKGEDGVWYWREVADSDYAYTLQQLAELKIQTNQISSTVTENKEYSDGEFDKLSSKITQTADSISTKVSKGSIISEINQTAESVTIKASKIDLDGLVSASQFTSKFATIDSLNANVANLNSVIATKIDASTVSANYATIASLNSTNASVNNLHASVASLNTVVASKITADQVTADLIQSRFQSPTAGSMTMGTIRASNFQYWTGRAYGTWSNKTMKINGQTINYVGWS